MITPDNNNIFPVGKRLLLEAYKQANETSAGLVVSEGDGNATSVMGTVIRAGVGCAFQPGDTLLWRRYSVDTLKVYTEEGEREFYLIEESEVIAHVKDEKTQDGRIGNYQKIKEKKDAIKEAQSSEEGEEERNPHAKERSR